MPPPCSHANEPFDDQQCGHQKSQLDIVEEILRVVATGFQRFTIELKRSAPFASTFANQYEEIKVNSLELVI